MQWTVFGLCLVSFSAVLAAGDAGVTPVPTPEVVPQPAPASVSENPDPLPPPAVRPFDTTPATGARPGSVELSNGEKLTGRLALTEGKTIRLFDLQSKTYHDVTFDTLKQIEVRVEFEKKEEEWTFKEGGNDEKIYSGNFYIDRRYQVRCTPLTGAAVTGYVLGTVFYLTTDVDGKPVKKRYFLHKDERGENKQEPKDLVYVKKVIFDSTDGVAALQPAAPANPAAEPPLTHATPAAPVAPPAPAGPRTPVAPSAPATPLAPPGPRTPLAPSAPATPLAPAGPRTPPAPPTPPQTPPQP